MKIDSGRFVDFVPLFTEASFVFHNLMVDFIANEKNTVKHVNPDFFDKELRLDFFITRFRTV